MSEDDFSKLRARIEEKKNVRKQTDSVSDDAPTEMSDKDIDLIVDRMKNKYRSQGLEFNEVEGQLGELKDIISGGQQKGVDVQSLDALRDGKNAFVRILGHLYFSLHGPFEKLGGFIEKFP